MAKSANLGGYFTPKPVTVEFFIEFNTDGIVTTRTTASITITASNSINVNPLLFNLFICQTPLKEKAIKSLN